MAYDERLADRIRDLLKSQSGISERKMFGGLAFMHQGHMICGVVKDELMVRVGADRYEDALARPHARPMDFSGRPMRGMVFVAAGGLRQTAALRLWVEQSLAFARTLPPKTP